MLFCVRGDEEDEWQSVRHESDQRSTGKTMIESGALWANLFLDDQMHDTTKVAVEISCSCPMPKCSRSFAAHVVQRRGK